MTGPCEVTDPNMSPPDSSRRARRDQSGIGANVSSLLATKWLLWGHSDYYGVTVIIMGGRVAIMGSVSLLCGYSDLWGLGGFYGFIVNITGSLIIMRVEWLLWSL